MTNQLPPLCACGCGDPVKWNKQKKCWNKYINGHTRKGKKFGPLSKEHREKISITNSGENGPFYNKHHTEESKKLISENHADFSGKNHPGYKNGGITCVISKQFLELKNYICERCGFQELLKNKTGKNSKIHAHHIIEQKALPEKVNDFSNLCALCCSCHIKYHKNNKGNINEESLMEFINQI